MLADGYNVRLLVRNVERARFRLGPEFGYSAGNVDDPDAVERALEGCVGVYVSLRGGSTSSSTGVRRESPSSPRGKAYPG